MPKKMTILRKSVKTLYKKDAKVPAPVKGVVVTQKKVPKIKMKVRKAKAKPVKVVAVKLGSIKKADESKAKRAMHEFMKVNVPKKK